MKVHLWFKKYLKDLMISITLKTRFGETKFDFADTTNGGDFIVLKLTIR